MQQGIELPAAVTAALRQLTGGIAGTEARRHQPLQFLPQLLLLPDRRRRRGPPEHQGALPQRRNGAEVGQGRRHRGADLLLMALGELPGDPQGAVTEQLQQILQERHQPMGRLEQHDRALLLREGQQGTAARGQAGRQESLEAEAPRGQAAAHQGGGDRAGPRHAHHRMAGGAGGGHQRLARIGDAGQARVADHGHGLTRRQGRQQLGFAGALVVLMEAQQPAADAEPLQQQAAAARVLAGDPVHPLQHPPRPGREVIAVADRGAHQIEHPRRGLPGGHLPRRGAGCCWRLRRVRHNGCFPASMMPLAPHLPPGVEREALLVELRRLAWGAADILRAYARGEQPPHGFPAALAVDEGGEGPVSAADLAVNQWLLDGLGQAFPSTDWTLLSEETASEQLNPGEPLPGDWLWILDPLDGTRDFLQGTGEYAVHLALVHRGRPVLGVVLLPEAEELWFGLLAAEGDGGEAWRENRAGERVPAALSTRRSLDELVLVASRNHRDARLEQLLAALELGDTRAMGSVGGKVATILRGETDLYISLSGKSAPKDWDMAAPEAVLRAAGGAFSHADGRALAYNNGDVRQAGCLIASHGPAHEALCQRAAAAMATIDPGFAV